MRRHILLNHHRARYRVHGAGKLDQDAIAGGLDDAAFVLRDGGIDDHFSGCLKVGQRAFLVGTHEAAITGNIRRQNGRKPPFDLLASQKMPLNG